MDLFLLPYASPCQNWCANAIEFSINKPGRPNSGMAPKLIGSSTTDQQEYYSACLWLPATKSSPTQIAEQLRIFTFVTCNFVEQLNEKG